MNHPQPAFTLNANSAWVNTIDKILSQGDIVAPRGKLTAELLHHAIEVDMCHPVVTEPGRKLNYRFMAAEAYWILLGANALSELTPYNARMAEFSDDGRTLFGAYGPRILRQLDYVAGKLIQDPMTRQATLTIWGENPPATKDLPCTVAMTFTQRNNRLNCHTYMRSSDAWLGLPYDIFSFSMVAHLLAAVINETRINAAADSDLGPEAVVPGTLYLTAASSHLYEEHHEAAKTVLQSPELRGTRETTPMMFLNGSYLYDRLRDLRETKAGDPLRWWEV